MKGLATKKKYRFLKLKKNLEKLFWPPLYFNKMVLQNTLRWDVSAILKSIHVWEIVQEFVWMKQW